MRVVVTFAFLLMLASVTPGGAQVRQLGPHVHGTSTLDIAVEGNTLTMELTAPSADIVGFESRPATYAQNVAITGAQKMLISPLSLFVLPPADCKVDTSDIEQRFEAQTGPGFPLTASGTPAEGPAVHSEFHASYSLTCGNPKAIKSIDFKYFQAFPGAQLVIIQLVSDQGQKSFRVERANPHLDLGGAI